MPICRKRAEVLPHGEAMTKVRFCRIVSTVFALALLGCGAGSSVSKRFAVTLKAVDDDGKPLNEVKFTSGRSTIGTTNELGRVSVTIRGTEGQSVSLVVTCPGGYAVPEEAPKLRLTEVRRVGQSDISGIWVETVCTRKMRDVVVVVRTAGAVVPVDIGGKTQGTTDVNGNAHFRVALDREVRSLSVSLGTRGATKPSTAEPVTCV